MEETNPPVVLNYATPIGHGDAPPGGSRLSLQRVEGGVCIVDPPRGRVAAIPGLIAIGGIELFLLLLLAEVVKEGMRHGIPVGVLLLCIGLLVILVGGLIWQAKIIWCSAQLPKTVEVRDGFLRVTNDPNLFGRNYWQVEKVRRVHVFVNWGVALRINRTMRALCDVSIAFRGFRSQRNPLRYLSASEALWAANVLNREMNLKEIRLRRKRLLFQR